MVREEPILKIMGVSKAFLRTKALQNVNFELYPREICGLLGENGAGKSTLMKILFGLYQADEGKIYIRGKEVKITSPKEALKFGIGMVHQHFKLVFPHQVWENVVLTTMEKSSFILDKSEVCERILKISRDFGWKIDPEAYISQLSVGEKQRVEIIKALLRNIDILILDEPTSVLTPQEIDSLFDALRKMVDKGLSIIFISHKLKEVISITNRVVVLRRGKVIGSIQTKDANVEELARMMVGDERLPKLEIKKIENRSSVSQKRRKLLEVKELCVEGDIKSGKIKAVKNVSFDIREGEILGLAGVSGNGQKELVEVLIGTRKLSHGVIYFEGKPISYISPSVLIQLRWARIPEDRMEEGLLLDLSVMENLILELHSDPRFTNGFFLNFKKIKKYAQYLINKYGISPPLSDISVNNLSGGNIQKVILARELYLQPRVIIASQPTRGLDIKAANFIHEIVLEEKKKGCAILLISEDIDEIIDLSDRIAVMYEGEIIDIVKREEVSRHRLGLLMAGIR